MFKYTSPWQVLVYSLDSHKRQSAAGHQDDLSSLQLFTLVHNLTPESRPSLDPSPTVMDSTPRRWELRPLSPSLQPSDLRSISVQQEHEVSFSQSISIVGSQSVNVEGHRDSSADVVVAARQVSVSQDGGSSSDELPISPCSSSAGSHSGFYSFVEDPLSPEAEQNEAWMVSPQRQSNLATLREENIFKLQTYSSHSKPGSLFQDDTDSQYEISPRYGYKVVGEEEERKLRKEIIRGQAPKKSAVVKKELDNLTNDTSRLIEGFSISYSRVNAKPKPSYVIDSDAIDEEQINFDNARKQFLQMEQNKLNPIIQPRKIQVKTSPKLKQDSLVLARREEQVFTPSVDDDVDAEEKNDLSSSHSRQSSCLEDSDGLSLNVSYSSTDWLAHQQIQPEDSASQISIEQETPIEREIRIAQEREENLRRSRGLQHSISRGEIVEIKTKRLNSPMPQTPSRTKEKGRVSFIFQEIQRKEEAIRQDGTPQDLGGPRRERVNSFDALQSNASEGDVVRSNQEYVVTKPFATLKENMGDKATLDVVDYALQKQNYTTQDGNKAENRPSNAKQVQEYDEVEMYGYTVKNDQVLAKNGEIEGFQSLEDRWQNHNGDRMENDYKIVVERSSVDSFSDDVFQLPCCPHKHSEDSDPSKQGQRQDSPRAASPQTPVWRDTLERTGLHTRGQGAQFIERDIEEALRREQELREQREARVRQVYSPQTLVQQADKMASTQFYPQNKTGKVESRSSSSVRPVRLSSVPLISPQPWSPAPQTRSSAVLQTIAQTPQTPSPAVVQTVPQAPQTPSPAVVQTTPFPVRGLTQTLLQDFEERRGKLKLEESKYAGIQPIDSVNNEVVESTRVTRHKNQRALQWEAGLFANQQDQ